MDLIKGKTIRFLAKITSQIDIKIMNTIKKINPKYAIT